MGKISPVSAKYIIHASIEIEGIVDRPDVIGAIFGQTEGLLGADLELRELQRSGRIGRIEVNVDTKTGKSRGMIVIPSSLDKAETSIVGAALEIIQRIGPCNAKIKVQKIEDVRITKRSFVVERAKELLRIMMDDVMPDSQELADEVSQSVRVMEIQEYGKERLAAGPMIDDSDEIMIVEGRADVLNLLKHGFKNAIAINGTSVPDTVKELTKKKTVTVFVDGDRGGDLIIKELLNVAEIDFVAKAPEGKEVEEITKKEIHKALRSRITAEQMKLEFSAKDDQQDHRQDRRQQHGQSARPQMTQSARPQVSQGPSQREQRDNRERPERDNRDRREQSEAPKPVHKRFVVTDDAKEKFEGMLEDLIGTRGAYILDEKLTILGKVPMSELETTLKSLNGGVHAIIFDGIIEKNLVMTAERIGVACLVAMESKVPANQARLTILTAADF